MSTPARLDAFGRGALRETEILRLLTWGLVIVVCVYGVAMVVITADRATNAQAPQGIGFESMVPPRLEVFVAEPPRLID